MRQVYINCVADDGRMLMLQHKNIWVGEFHPVCQALTSIMHTLNCGSCKHTLNAQPYRKKIVAAVHSQFPLQPISPIGHHGQCQILSSPQFSPRNRRLRFPRPPHRLATPRTLNFHRLSSRSPDHKQSLPRRLLLRCRHHISRSRSLSL